MKQANEIQRAAVLGGGTMGHGIAQSLAQAGVETRLYDVAPDVLRQARAKVQQNLDQGVEKGKVKPEEREGALARLSTTSDFAEAIRGADAVIEAVPERIALKQELFQKLGAALPRDVLLATNTSSLPVSQIASAARHPERVTGMHFFNPVHIMKLVEVVRGEQSSPEAVSASADLARRMGKDPITVKDSPGFASSRLGLVIGLEAMRMVQDGVASAEDIDKAMTLGYGFPMGPLRLTDVVGLDVRLAIAEYLAGELGPHFEPPELLRAKVGRGELGKKSGQGFYKW
jgi:3-hydroxybutyryl-CoA dehydrogenase